MKFDYEVLHNCQYEIGGGDCGEPATHRVWLNEHSTLEMVVCQEHLDYMKSCESTQQGED